MNIDFGLAYIGQYREWGIASTASGRARDKTPDSQRESGSCATSRAIGQGATVEIA
jgi:hypothetical protein